MIEPTAIVHEQVSDSEFGPPLPKLEDAIPESKTVLDGSDEDEWIIKPVVVTYVDQK